MDFPAIRFDRIVLRGGADSVARARAQLPAALAHHRWPAADDDAILVVRRVAVSGSLPELPARAAAAATRAGHRAADPWSAAADSADAVRFASALDYRACLIHDLLAGSAARRWIWHHRGKLRAPSLAQTIVTQLAEDILRLPDVLAHRRVRAKLPRLWRSIDQTAARVLLQAISAATGWSSAIDAALATPATAAQLESDRSQTPLAKQSHPSASPPLPVPAATDAINRPSLAPSTSLSGATGRPAALEKLTKQHSLHQPETEAAVQALTGLPPNDARVVLQALLQLWLAAPALLCSANGGSLLRKTAQALVTDTAAAPAPLATPQPDPTPGPAITRPPAASPTAAAPSPAGHDEAAAAASSARTPAPTSSDRAAPMQPSAAAAIRPELSLPPALAHDFLSHHGSLFFLLNVVNLPVLKQWRAALTETRAGWRELVRLALRIGVPIDLPLAAFLADAYGLEPDNDPLGVLGSLGPGHDDSTVDAAFQRFHGDAALAALRLERLARVRATATRIDLYLRLAEVNLDIRRAGLDIDPGWLPWLGCVVRFHYDRGGFTP